MPAGAAISPQDPTPAPAGCRIVPMDVVERTTGSDTITMTYKGRFDRSSLESILDATFSNAAGTRYSFRQVTKYRSVEELVREASVVPVLNLWVRAEDTGGIVMTVVNTFDDKRRLLTTENGQPSGRDTIVYSEWDDKGRPIRGQVKRNGTPGSEYAYRYDDKNRIMVHTIRTAGAVMEQATTFDSYGNPVKRETRGPGALATTTTFTNREMTTICAHDPRPAEPQAPPAAVIVTLNGEPPIGVNVFVQLGTERRAGLDANLKAAAEKFRKGTRIEVYRKIYEAGGLDIILVPAGETMGVEDKECYKAKEPVPGMPYRCGWIGGFALGDSATIDAERGRVG